MDDMNLLQRCRDLICFLQSVTGEDSNRADQAAELFERYINLYATNPKGAIQQILYGFSPKGIQDWIWSPQNRKRIEELTRLTK